MTDNEFYEYIKGNPTITGIVTHMKTWWSNEGTDKDLQDLFNLIIKLDNSKQWIPCCERLPKKKGYYLVTRKNPKGHVTRVSYDPSRVERGVYNSPWGNGDADVLARMELPKAYEVKEE